jgi:hypothetical protein
MTTPAGRPWLTLILVGLLIAECRGDRRGQSASAIGSAASRQDGQQPLQACKIELTPIADGRMGVLRVGMTPDELRATCPGAAPQAGTDEEGSQVTLFAIPVSDRDTVFADLETAQGQPVVRSFSIEFAGPHTVDGIAVGSTYRDVRSKYPRLGADDNEGRVYVWPERDRGISFALSIARDALKPGWREAPTVIPDSAHVIELLIRAPVKKS